MPDRRLVTDPERVEVLAELREWRDDDLSPPELRYLLTRAIPFIEIEGEPADA